MSPGLASVRLLIPVSCCCSSPMTVPPTSWATSRTVTRMSFPRRWAAGRGGQGAERGATRRRLRGIAAVDVLDERLGDVERGIGVEQRLHAELELDLGGVAGLELRVRHEMDQQDAVLLAVFRQQVVDDLEAVLDQRG